MFSSCENVGITQNFYVNYKISYSNLHIGWFQFLEKKLQKKPKLIYKFEDRLIVFIDEKNYKYALRNWHSYLKNRENQLNLHVRIIKYSNNLAEIVHNWFSNIKNLKVNIRFFEDFYDITIEVPPNLRQFVIGKSGCEIEMLISFFESCIRGKFNYQLKII